MLLVFQVNGTYFLIFKCSSAYFITLRNVSVSKYPQIKFLYSRRHIVWQTQRMSLCSRLWHASTYQPKHLGLKTFHLVNRFLCVAKVKGILKTSVTNASAVSALLSDAEGRMTLQISTCCLCNPKFGYVSHWSTLETNSIRRKAQTTTKFLVALLRKCHG